MDIARVKQSEPRSSAQVQKDGPGQILMEASGMLPGVISLIQAIM